MEELSETFKALSDPSRRRQLERLAGGPATSGQLAQLLSMSRPAGSQHLAVLTGTGLVETTAMGRQRWHTLRPEKLYQAQAWLAELLSAWEQSGRSADVATSIRAEPRTGQLPSSS